jgi:branched-chain amino acid transport system substrate-binding protein
VVAPRTVGTRFPAGRGLSRRSVLSFGALGITAAALSACADPSVAASPAPAGDPIVVGACLELTGPNRVAGRAQSDALEIIQATIRDQDRFIVGGRTRQVRLVIQDNQGDPQRAAAITRSLIATHNVTAVIGGTTAATSLAMAPIAEQLGVPMLSLSAAGAITTPIASRQWVYKLGPNAGDVATVIAGVLRATGKSAVAIMATSDPHGDDGVQALTTAMTADAGLRDVVTVRLPDGVATLSTYQSQAESVARTNPDAVVIWALAPAASFAARALNAAGYTGTVYFDSGAASTDTLDNVNPHRFQGAYVVSPEILGGAQATASTPGALAQQDFYVRYTQKNIAFDGLAVYAADALRLIVNAATVAQSFDQTAIRDALESRPYEEIAGTYVFSSIDHGGVQSDSLAILQITPSGWLQID